MKDIFDLGEVKQPQLFDEASRIQTARANIRRQMMIYKMGREQVQKAIQAKVDRVTKGSASYKPLDGSELKEGEWYIGASPVCRVAQWDGEIFVTVIIGGGVARLVEMFYSDRYHEQGRYFAPLKQL